MSFKKSSNPYDILREENDPFVEGTSADNIIDANAVSPEPQESIPTPPSATPQVPRIFDRKDDDEPKSEKLAKEEKLEELELSDSEDHPYKHHTELTHINFSKWSVFKRLGINLLIPFINGICLGFGEIMAHEIGLIWGWRAARVYDPESKTLNPKNRRKWLFGF